ncbi:MAG TPA: glycosyltransferase [Blastocatellia bacterium]|nr:glycosyltransferase [Blastocatellia bacterium]
MKIIFLIRQLNYAGAERQLVTLAKRLQQRGHSVSVAVFYADGPLESELRQSSVPVHSLDKRGRWDTLGFMWRLFKLVRREQPDILHGYLTVSNIFTALIGTMCPGVQTAWGVRSSNMDLENYDWLMRVSYRVERWFSRFADLIIVNSYAGLDYAAAQGYPSEKMIVIPNGVDTERFRPDREAGRRVRHEWRLTDEQILIGLVGRIDPMKDHATFLEAAALLAREHPALVFACVGRSVEPYKSKLVEISKQLGLDDRLIWSEAREDIPDVYNALDVLVSSSCSEGFSNVVVEAMASGVPCVVTDVGDSKMIVGNCGEVVRPQDAPALKSAIERRLDKRRADHVEDQPSRQRIVDRFSVIELEAKTEAALLSLCKGAA